jgi:hypothetical protein
MARSPADPDPLRLRVAWLRKRFAAHNRLVVLVALLTLFVTAGLWFLLFAVLYWLAFLFTSIVHGADARPSDALPALFIYSAGLLLLLAWIARGHSKNEMPKDEKTPWEIATEFLLAVPRATLAVWGNLSAWQRLDRREMEIAAEFVEHLAAEGRVPLQQLPLHIPEARDQMRILLALQLIEAITVTRVEDTMWVAIRAKDEAITVPDER